MTTTYYEAASAWLASMADNWSIKLALGTATAFLADVFGEDLWLITVLFCLIVADFSLGMLSALKRTGGLDGRRLHGGMVKFIAYAAAIILVWLVQEICIRSIHIELPILAVFAAYQSLTELSSVTRHLERLGLKMPALLHRITSGGAKKMDEKIDEVLGVDEHVENS